MSSTRAIRKVELDAGKRAEIAYFVIEYAQNVRFVPKNVQSACNSARKNARRANNAQSGRLTCR